MILIADSSALIALSLCDSLELLEKIFSEVKVPKAVFEEVCQKSKKESQRLSFFLKNKIVDVSSMNLIVIRDGTLELGELEAMTLYKHLNADRLLVDDKRARKIAQMNKIDVIGSIGVLLLGKKRGLISEVKQKLLILKQSDIFLSEEIIQFALFQAGEN